MSQGNSFRAGQQVRWNWGSGEGTGKVVERFDRRVQRTIKGATNIHDGSAKNPAFSLSKMTETGC